MAVSSVIGSTGCATSRMWLQDTSRSVIQHLDSVMATANAHTPTSSSWRGNSVATERGGDAARAERTLTLVPFRLSRRRVLFARTPSAMNDRQSLFRPRAVSMSHKLSSCIASHGRQPSVQPGAATLSAYLEATHVARQCGVDGAEGSPALSMKHTGLRNLLMLIEWPKLHASTRLWPAHTIWL